MDKSATLKQNNIKDKTIILIVEESEEDNDESQKLIAVIFSSIKPIINFAIPCHIYDKFSTIEQKLYFEYPELNEKKINFLVNGALVNKSVTLEQNKIKNGTNILIIHRSEETIDKRQKPISILFISTDQRIHYSMVCYIHNQFSTIEQKLYSDYPELKGKELYFLSNGNVVNKSATLEQNNIKNGTIILIDYVID